MSMNIPRYQTLLALILLAVSIYVESKEIKFSGMAKINMPPYLWYDNCTESLTGRVPYMVDTLLKSLPFESRLLDPINPSKALVRNAVEKLQRGEIDMAILIPSQKTPGIWYSSTAMLSGTTVLVYRRNMTLNPSNIVDFKGLRGLMVTGFIDINLSPLYRRLTSQGLNITPSAEFEESLNVVVDGLADYVVMDRSVASMYLRKLAYKDKFSVFSKTGNHYLFHLAVSMKSPVMSHRSVIEELLVYHANESRKRLTLERYMRQWLETKNCHR